MKKRKQTFVYIWGAAVRGLYQETHPHMDLWLARAGGVQCGFVIVTGGTGQDSRLSPCLKSVAR